ncbi:MAG: hypothetical protein HRU41_33205 [Saprospiraceae bacterium]|nr:hypothetical protein [Saprospiraceae bacterium]
MSKRRQKLMASLRELFVVILGILIALFINNWKENRDNEHYVDQTLQAISKEISQNEEALQGILPRHQSILDTLENYFEDDTKSLRWIATQAGGVQYPEVKNIGLRFFISNKADLIDYDIISHLNDVESGKAILDKKFEKLMDYSYESIEKTDEESKITFAIRLADIVDTEEYLLELYQQGWTKQD